jgi:hypothetical protein
VNEPVAICDERITVERNIGLTSVTCWLYEGHSGDHFDDVLQIGWWKERPDIE